MKQRKFTRPVARLLLCALLLNLALLLSACGGASGASATAMHLKKTEGTVGVADDAGNDVAPAENLSLYSGYTVATEAESYAWIDLDSAKLAKMDAESAVEIVKGGKNLTVNVQTGSLFFNVTEPLANDETMEICTSSLMAGIRGTCGWVEQNRVGLLEGVVTVTAGEQSVTVNAGEMAVLTEDGALEVKPFSATAVPAFVRAEVAQDAALAAQVLEAAGMDLTTDPLAPYAHLITRFFDEALYTELVDFAQDGGDPKLLVIGTQNKESPEDGVTRPYAVYAVFSFDPDAPVENRYAVLCTGSQIMSSETLEIPMEIVWSLMESDGRLYIQQRWEQLNADVGAATYEGFNGEGLWTYEHIGHDTSHNGEVNYRYGLRVQGDSSAVSRLSDAGEYAAVQAKYTEVKRLAYSPDGATITVVAP